MNATAPPPQILIIEDDPEISQMLSTFLEQQGFAVATLSSGQTLDSFMARREVDLVLLDLMLPGEHGLSLCRRLREGGKTRIILLSALAEQADKVVGLELGADDYITKPFDLRELLARIRAVLRRPLGEAIAPGRIGVESAMVFDDYRFFPQRRYVETPSGLRVTLTAAEADLLFIFCQHPRRVLSRDQLLAMTKGPRHAAIRSIDMLVSRLRRKLEQESMANPLIRTMRSGGYLFQPDITVE